MFFFQKKNVQAIIAPDFILTKFNIQWTSDTPCHHYKLYIYDPICKWIQKAFNMIILIYLLQLSNSKYSSVPLWHVPKRRLCEQAHSLNFGPSVKSVSSGKNVFLFYQYFVFSQSVSLLKADLNDLIWSRDTMFWFCILLWFNLINILHFIFFHFNLLKYKSF